MCISDLWTEKVPKDDVKGRDCNITEMALVEPF